MKDDGKTPGAARSFGSGRLRSIMRFARDGRFGLHVPVGAVLTFVLMWVFFRVVGRESLLRWDMGILHSMQNYRTPALDEVMLFFTTLGNWQTVIWGMICASVILSLRNRRHAIVALLVSVIGGALFVTAIKVVIQRPRPPIDLALTQARSFSFPSGHSFVAFSFYGLVTYLLIRSLRGAGLRTLALLGGFALVIGIGSSRIYLGVHWPSDVLASYAFGSIWLIAMIGALEISTDTGRRPDSSGRNVAYVCWLFFFMWLGYAAVSTRMQHVEPAHMVAPAHERVQRGGYASPVTFVSNAYMQSRQVA